MKIAFLCNVPDDLLDLFRQRIEDAINSVDGTLIYQAKSRNPIRILCAQGDKYPPTDTPLPSERAVKDASQTQHRGMDHGGDSRSRFARGHGGSLPELDPASQRVQERDGWKLDGRGLGHRSSHPRDFGSPPGFRLCVSPEIRRTQTLISLQNGRFSNPTGQHPFLVNQ